MYYVLSFIAGLLVGAIGFALISKAKEKNVSEGKLSLEKNDIILKVNEERICNKKDIKPGKYTLHMTVEGVESVNIKINGFVKDYKRNTEIILNENDTIKAVSHNVLLRK
ncbi:MAG: hypothetical protein E7184_01890 [Erysipelotrichaceae bacterium]|nr:hypothetical protein [Erysipelotrichaceae bacterium]